jgi:hypothetical protein
MSREPFSQALRRVVVIDLRDDKRVEPDNLIAH